MALNAHKDENVSAKLQESEYTTNKVLFVVAVCLFGIIYLVWIKRLLSYGSTFMASYNFVRGVGIAAVIGIPVGQMKKQKERRNGMDSSFMLFSGKNIMTFCALLAIVHGYIAYYYISAINTLYFILPGMAVLYLIYNVYQREFFVVSLDCALAAGLLWVVGKGIANSDKIRFSQIAIITVGFIAIIQIIMVVYASKHEGYISTIQEPEELSPKQQERTKWKKAQMELSMNDQMKKEREERYKMAMMEATRKLAKRVPMFTTKRGCIMLILTPLIMLAIHLCAYFILQNTYYLMFVIIAYFFVSAVYYTVKIL